MIIIITSKPPEQVLLFVLHRAYFENVAVSVML
jgi:hypothetical protein